MELGVCKLCLNERPLVNSHLMARGLHDFCRTSNDDPIFISSKIVMQTARQLQYPLLCKECDGSLSRNGEDWLIPQLASFNATFPLYDLLQKVPPDLTDGTSGLYAASRNPEIDIAKLTHFAMGVFWKASVHSWQGGETAPLIQLGKYGESVRRFVCGECPFPEKMALIVGVVPPPVKTINLSFPYRGAAREYHNFLFFVLGVQFALFVGNAVSTELKRNCFASNPLHPILMSEKVSDGVMSVIRDVAANAHLAKNVQPYLDKKD